MRALSITADATLHRAEVPEPVPADGEILIDVTAAGINRGDLAQVAGSYPPPPGASSLPGLEISGHRRDTGEAVVALLAGGGYAETVAVPEAQVLPAPEGLDLVDAGGLIEVAATVVSNLHLEAGLTAGETVLIIGGTGGIGTAAIQVASLLGARVLTTVGSDGAVEAARELGADLAWNRHTTDLPAVIDAEGGVDVILDVVGGPDLSRNVRLLREHGRLVVIGTIGGSRGELDVRQLMMRRARVIGTTLRSRAVEDKARILQATQELLWPAIADGRFTLPVHARLPLEDGARGQEILQAGGHLGKVILQVRP
ncbi:MAG: NAD(P)H-quinone oxidoreductase [Brachybacterium sp.]|nr:NAD(P)H-quinone oxidoreductase [Brachybacterium sp.]